MRKAHLRDTVAVCLIHVLNKVLPWPINVRINLHLFAIKQIALNVHRHDLHPFETDGGGAGSCMLP